ncbi:glycosyltransferase family 2 protein [Ceratobasidium sp. AG-I]|nr:glycosyltransferase family 2 protein [Ceratobasidium sp. AG-I]
MSANALYQSPGYAQSSVPIPTTRPPPTRAPARTGPSGTLKRGKTLTRPERGVAPAPLINPPAPLLPAAGALPVAVAPSESSWDPWVTFSRVVTFWAPAFLLSSLGGLKDPATRQAWREKVALCLIAAVLAGTVGFATIGLERVLCPESASSRPGTLVRMGAQSGVLGVSGWQVNITNSLTSPGADFYDLATKMPGQDITNLFTRAAADFPACRGATYAAATDAPCAIACPLAAPNAGTLSSLKITNTSAQIGYDWDQVTLLTNFLVVDGAVLNFQPYMTQHPNAINNDPIDTAIRTVLRVRPGKSGKDATRLFTNRAQLQAAIPCLTQRYYAGRIDKITPGCFVNSLFLYVSLIVIMSIVLVRFAMACIFNWFLSARLAAPPKNLGRTVISPAVLPEGANLAVDSKNGTAPWADNRRKLAKKGSGRSSPAPSSVTSGTNPAAAPLITAAQIGAELYSVCLVTCYSEGEASLRTTLDSISATTYSDERKLLFIVADGMVTGAGEKMSTPDTCVSLLEADPRFGNPMPMAYESIGSGAKKSNRAMVYAGHYTKAGRRTPTIVVVKCGTEVEARTDKKPGNRGKRDSQLILMNFFSRVTYNDRMAPLDFDMFRKIQVLMGVTPDFFEVCLMVDADTKVFPESLRQLVNSMHHDNFIMGVCGETRIANKRESWITAIQVYEYFISHHLAKSFESVFGGVTCLPGCFSLYRLKARKADDDDWVPLLVKPEIVREYSQSEVHTLHQKNLLLLGEDRFLTTILIRTFPNRKMMFCPQARCRTVVPDTFSMLLSQRRRWINSTMHNLMELVRVRNLCGTFCFSMQFVVFMDLIGTTILPVAITLTYVLIVTLALNPPDTFEKAIPLMLLVTVLGLPAVLILITTRKVVYVFWMGIYLLALPIWNFVLPLYAYWHFDDFSWGETRKVEGEGKDTGHGEGAGVAVAVPLRRWEDWERSRLRKIKREEKRRREIERAQQYFQGGLRADGSNYDGGSDTASIVSSEDDMWAHQVGGYNEQSTQYPPPPVTFHRPDGGRAPGSAGSGGMMGKEEMEAMLNGGFDSPPPVPPLPQNAQRYQLSDGSGGGGGGYSPVMRDGPNASSSAVWERTHAKRRSGNGHPPGPDEGLGARQGYGPLGPLGPSR